MRSRRGKAWQLTLTAYALYAAGCHGWVPAILQPVLLLIFGGLLLTLAGPPRVGPLLGWLRFAPLVIGIWGRQNLDVDLLASLGILAGLWFVGDSSAEGTSRRQLTARALLLFALLQLLLSSTAGFYFEEMLAGLLNQIASVLTGQTVRLGPVFGGARVLLFCIASLLVLTRAGVARWAVLLGVLLTVAVVVTGGVAMAAANLSSFGSTPSIPPIASVTAAQLPWVPFAAGVLSVPLLARLTKQEPTPTGRDRVVAALGVVTAAFVLASLPPAALRPAQKLVFYRPGFSNWELPNPSLKRAGPFSSGMLGSLPQFARAMGLGVDLVDRIDTETLDGCDTLVLINLNEPIDATPPTAISSWVRSGGHLIVVGDHTFLRADGEGWKNFLNEPLADCDIRYPNNSSDHLTAGVLDATVTTGLGRRLDCVPGNPHSPIIGAGLHLRWPARPIVICRFGYEDAGRMPDKENDKALGDLTWNPGEPLGGVVLLAEQQVGVGRVTVVGDTTGFHNIARSMAWRATGDLILGRERDGRWSYWLSALALLALAAYRFWRSLPVFTDSLVSVAVLSTIATVGNLDRSAVPLIQPDEPLLILDTAAMPAGRLGNWAPEGHLTLVSSALRVGYLPLITSTAEHGIPVGTVVVLLSGPRVDPGTAWRERLISWVRGGGHLIVAGGHAMQRVHGELLAEIGCAIDPLVIPPQTVQIGDPSEQGFIIRMAESWNLRVLHGEWTRIVYGEQTISMASRRLGTGKVTVITDRTLLQNRNQESEDIINPENLRFTMRLLRGEARVW